MIFTRVKLKHKQQYINRLQFKQEQNSETRYLYLERDHIRKLLSPRPIVSGRWGDEERRGLVRGQQALCLNDRLNERTRI